MMSPRTELLLRSARIPGSAELADVLLVDGVVTAIIPAGSAEDDGLQAGQSRAELNLDGRWLSPGLWDSHVHFTQWVIRRQRIDLSGTASAADVLAIVRDQSTVGADAPQTRVLTGYGFRDALWPDQPTVAALDAVSGDRPVVLISGDLHCGWLNTRAAALLNVETDRSGVLRETPWIAVLDRLDGGTLPATGDYAAAATAAASRGVVGIVEFENANNARLWPERVAAGVTALRVETSVWPDRLHDAIDNGWRTGQALDSTGLIRFGRLKVVVDGSLNTRTAYCWDPYPGLSANAPHPCGVQSVSPDELRTLLEIASANGILPAVHAIGDRANSLVIDEFERLGIRGVIEHAQLVSGPDFERFGRLGLVASVQPEHAMDDRDVADRYWGGRTDRAFAFKSLHDAGATIRLGSDAPVAALDPWHAIAAATDRSRDGRDVWHPEQRLPIEVALAASTRGRTTVREGDSADLVVLEHNPLTATAKQLRSMPVAATLLGGRLTWNSVEGLHNAND